MVARKKKMEHQPWNVTDLYFRIAITHVQSNKGLNISKCVAVNG